MAKSRFHIEYLNPQQRLAYGVFQQHDVMFLTGPAGTGKAQPLDATVFTPQGPVRMGDINLGDLVCTPDGLSARVIGVFPQGEKLIYKIVFTDGDSVECCGEHLWVVSSISNGWKNKVVNTDYIKNNYVAQSGRLKLAIETTNPVVFDDRKIELDPYVMGVLLGDGCFVGPNLTISTADESILLAISQSIESNYILKKANKYDWRLVKAKKSSSPNLYKEVLKSYCLWGKRSEEKHIPEEYMFNSVDVRLSVLQGLMDSDGTIDKRTGSCSLSTSSYQLAKDFKLLVASLGGVCRIIKKRVVEYIYKGEQKIGLPAYICTINLPNFPLFRLERKLTYQRKRAKYLPKKIICGVECVGTKEAKCILLDNIDHLYLTDNFIVTHNTFLAMAFAINEVLQRKKSRIILTRPIVESGENLGYLPGDFYEKVNPYMMPLYDVVPKLVGHEGPQSDSIKAAIEVVPLAYMRGRSFANSICLFDEAQNATYPQLKLFLSRFEKDTKLIITGDPFQSDLKSSTVDLMDVVHRLETLPGIGFVQFKKEHIVRHPLVAQILERLDA
jgi:hypothetical protein